LGGFAMSEKQEEESGLDQLARGRMTTLDESDKALHQMCKTTIEEVDLYGDHTTLEEITENLKGVRLRAGLSQMELADRSGVSQTYVNFIERGIRPITVDNAAALMSALSAALVEREEARRKIDAIVERLFPWTEVDERRLRERQRKLKEGR